MRHCVLRSKAIAGFALSCIYPILSIIIPFHIRAYCELTTTDLYDIHTYVFYLCPGGGGNKAARTGAEYTAGKRFRFIDIDVCGLEEYAYLPFLFLVVGALLDTDLFIT